MKTCLICGQESSILEPACPFCITAEMRRTQPSQDERDADLAKSEVVRLAFSSNEKTTVKQLHSELSKSVPQHVLDNLKKKG